MKLLVRQSGLSPNVQSRTLLYSMETGRIDNIILLTFPET